MTQAQLQNAVMLNKELERFQYLKGILNQIPSKSSSEILSEVIDLCKEHGYVQEAIPRHYNNVVLAMRKEVEKFITDIQNEIERI